MSLNHDIPFPELRKLFLNDPLSLTGVIPGIFPINKPRGISSHQVVSIARKKLGLRRVGHGGTLDPLAEGLLLILTSRATRLFDELQGFPKTYRATLTFGTATDTQDSTGAITEEFEPRTVEVKEKTLLPILKNYSGKILQTPPMYSALKKNGRPLYKLAREGKTIKREPREVEVYNLQLLSLADKPESPDTGPAADRRICEIIANNPTAVLEMTVSSGFYVRTLIDDIGRDLHCGAFMTKLVRTRIGSFELSAATTPDEIAPLKN